MRHGDATTPGARRPCDLTRTATRYRAIRSRKSASGSGRPSAAALSATRLKVLLLADGYRSEGAAIIPFDV
jgi:hypothetical protein